MNRFDPESVAALRQELESAGRVLITTHLNPDGDALGSALAFSWALEQLGVAHDVVNHNLAPYNLNFLPGAERLQLAPLATEYDFGVVLDLSSLSRLGRAGSMVEALPRFALIDHHVPHDAPGDLRFVDTHAPATALLVDSLFQAWGLTITPNMATCLLCGIVTDTGSFRFRNTTPECLHRAAELLHFGGDLGLISEEVYMKRPSLVLGLLGHALEHMTLEMGERLAYTTLPESVFTRLGAREEHTEGFTNELLAVETVQIAAVLRQPPGGILKASLRSRGDHDMAAVAAKFGGGGHRNAAGCTFDIPLHEAERALVMELRLCLES